MSQLAVSWEPFVLAPPELEYAIERRKSDSGVSAWLDGWKQLQREGWDACRGGPPRWMLGVAS